MSTQFIREQISLFSHLRGEYEILDDLYSQKLWHQLSIALEKFLSNSANIAGDNFFDLYHGFISPIAGKLSQLRLALLVSLIAYTFQDPSRAVDFLSKILESRERLGPEASLCIESDIIVMKLRLGLVDECRTLIDEAKDKLQLANTSEAIVFSKYYKAVSEFRKLAGPPEEFYKVSLTYLSYTPLESLSSSEQYELASDMSLAALTGEGVYNFGEVLATPLLATLDGTENQYLFDLIKAMNTGDIDSYNSLVNLHSERYFNQPVLKTFHEKIQQKVVLLCLMDMIFKRSSHDRTIAYQDISDKTRLPLEQVDWVVMKALSLGLIKGSLDEVDQTVNVTWVQPKVLDHQQIAIVVNQLTEWSDRVKRTLVAVEEQALELYV